MREKKLKFAGVNGFAIEFTKFALLKFLLSLNKNCVLVLNILSIQKLSKKYPQNQVFAVKDFSLAIKKGEIVAITGESGCGKTTLLRLIAGLEVPDEGTITIHHQIVADKTTWIKPEQRHVGMVFQDYALFPHLNIKENIAFGLNKEQNKKEVIREILTLVGLYGYENRYPHELSGGQQQRVALARALAPQPTLLLLDEPFSNLDEMLKEQVREDLLQIIRQTNITSLLVTHDVKDALAIADRIVVMKQGKLQQCSYPKDIYEYPANVYVGRFFGKMNVLEGNIQNHALQTALGNFPVSNPQTKSIGIRPEHIDLSIDNLQGGQKQKIKGVISKVNFLGAYCEVIAQIGNAEVVVRTNNAFEGKIGQEAVLEIKKYCEW